MRAPSSAVRPLARRRGLRPTSRLLSFAVLSRPAAPRRAALRRAMVIKRLQRRAFIFCRVTARLLVLIIVASTAAAAAVTFHMTCARLGANFRSFLLKRPSRVVGIKSEKRQMNGARARSSVLQARRASPIWPCGGGARCLRDGARAHVARASEWRGVLTLQEGSGRVISTIVFRAARVKIYSHTAPTTVAAAAAHLTVTPATARRLQK